MQIPKIQEYIKNYDRENMLFNEIGPKAKEQGYLTFYEFYKICMWKSARPKQKFIQNKDSIEAITKKAFQEQDEAKKVIILCELKGIGIPTASAILSVVFPEKYGIIDIRAIETLNDLGYKINKTMTLKNWLNYTKTVNELAKENSITPRQVDMALFAIHREKQESEGFKNLYKK